MAVAVGVWGDQAVAEVVRMCVRGWDGATVLLFGVRGDQAVAEVAPGERCEGEEGEVGAGADDGGSGGRDDFLNAGGSDKIHGGIVGRTFSKIAHTIQLVRLKEKEKQPHT